MRLRAWVLKDGSLLNKLGSIHTPTGEVYIGIEMRNGRYYWLLVR